MEVVDSRGSQGEVVGVCEEKRGKREGGRREKERREKKEADRRMHVHGLVIDSEMRTCKERWRGRGGLVGEERKHLALYPEKTVCSLSLVLFFGSSIHSRVQWLCNPPPNLLSVTQDIL